MNRLLLALAASLLLSASTPRPAAGPLTLLPIANSGVLVTAGDSKVLIDALFDKPNPVYRAPAPETIDKIMRGAAPFDGIDLVLVTHNHPDHFDPGLAVRYLGARPEAFLVAPADAVAEMRKRSMDWAKIEPRITALDLKIGEKGEWPVHGISVTAFRTLHGQSETPLNLMYLFEIGGSRVFHEGDSNSNPDEWEAFGLGGARIDLALVHFWFPFVPIQARLLQDLNPAHVALTHLPVKDEERYPAMVDGVRSSYKDLFLLSPGGPSRILDPKGDDTPRDPEGPYFGQTPPGTVPQRFASGLLSTAGYDITPTFSPALDEVFFGCRATEEGNDNRLHYSRMVDGRWQKPAVASFLSDGLGFEAQFSVDGNTLYFNRGKMMCFSQRTAKGWSEARVIDPPADEGMCIASARNGTLYFTAARNRAYGIFRSRCVDGRYQTPEIVIPMAAHPWVAPDESYLVFDKYAFREGVQTSKLFVSFRRQDGSWSDPLEFGTDINATGTELIAKVSPDGRYLFFQRKVDGNTDIYWVDAKVIKELGKSESRDPLRAACR